MKHLAQIFELRSSKTKSDEIKMFGELQLHDNFYYMDLRYPTAWKLYVIAVRNNKIESMMEEYYDNFKENFTLDKHACGESWDLGEIGEVCDVPIFGVLGNGKNVRYLYATDAKLLHQYIKSPKLRKTLKVLDF